MNIRINKQPYTKDMKNTLKKEIAVAAKREHNDDHLTEEERKLICGKIREEENIGSDVTDEQIFEEFIIG